MDGWVSSSLRTLANGFCFDLTVARATQNAYRVAVKGRVRVFLPQGDATPKIIYGTGVRVRSYLEEIPHYSIPGVEDRRRSLWYEGIAWQVRLKSLRQVEMTGETFGCPVRRLLDLYRDRFVRFCDGHLLAPRASLVLGAFLGEGAALSGVERSQVRRLGVLHLFVVSGLHVGLLLLFLDRALSSLGAAGRIVTLVLVWAYVGMSGSSMPALRAGFMVSGSYFLHALGSRGRLLNQLGLAGLVLLMIQPLATRSAGLQFSFLALVALGLSSEAISRAQFMIKQGTRVWSSDLFAGRKPEQVRARRLRFALEDWLDPVSSDRVGRLLGVAGSSLAPLLGLLIAAMVVQLGTLPLSLYYTNYWTWSQWLANVTLIPVFSLFVPACFLLLLLFWTPFQSLPSALVSVLAGAIEVLLSGQGKAALVSFLPHPGGLELVCYFGILAAALVAGGRGRWLMASAPIFLFAALQPTPLLPSSQLTITLLDVGQGESLHLTYPNGQSALFDAGGFSFSEGGPSDFVGERLVSRYLWTERVPRLRFALMSHPHLDHIQGLDFVARVLPVGVLYFHEAHPLYRRLPGLQLVAGDSFVVGGVFHRVLHPPADDDRSLLLGTNNSSLVVLIKYGLFAMLLTGDIEARGERMLAPGLQPVTVLKIPHHGSKTSSSERLLQRARPRIALISAGRNNQFGHPAVDTLKRLNETGAHVMLTSKHGSVRVRSDGFCFSAGNYVPQQQRFAASFSECFKRPFHLPRVE